MEFVETPAPLEVVPGRHGGWAVMCGGRLLFAGDLPGALAAVELHFSGALRFVNVSRPPAAPDPEEQRRETEEEIFGAISADMGSDLTDREYRLLRAELMVSASDPEAYVKVAGRLATWLLEQIDKAEEAATALSPAAWTTNIWRALETAIASGREAAISVCPPEKGRPGETKVIVAVDRKPMPFAGAHMLLDASRWLVERLKP